MSSQQPEGRQWSGKTGGGNFGQRFLLKVLKSVNVVFFYPILYLVVPFYCVVNYRAFGCIYRYFREIHHFSAWKSFWSTVRNHLIFGRVVLDRFAILAGNSKQFKIEVDGQEVFTQMLDSSLGMIVAGSHVGNFELVGHFFHQDKKTINAIVFGGERAGLQRRREASFETHNEKMIPVTSDLSHIFALKDALDRGEIAVILCDRIWGSRKTLTVDFLGKPAKFPLGTFLLAAQMDVPVVSLIAVKERGTRYHGFVKRFDSPDPQLSVREKSQFYARQYAENLQDILRKYPEQWFNFYDFWA